MLRCSLPRLAILAGLLAAGLVLAPRAVARQFDSKSFRVMRWRLIGPYRAGRVTTVAGIPENPAVYYMGTPGGGVWKTTDGGTVWKPIFDAAHVASIGALALAPSDPNVIYVGTGEQSPGKGVYKSNDDGRTWTPVGLADTRYISSVVVDSRDPSRVLVGALGAPTPNRNRGVYQSTDGGKSWQQVLFKDEETGVADLTLDPNNPQVVYAALWHIAFGRGAHLPEARDGWIYKSTDGGATWQSVGQQGLPGGRRGRIGIAVAPGNDGRRVYAIMDEGLFRSDDAGETWNRITKDPRAVGNGYFSRVFVDPKNADVVYVMQTSTYRSTDGGVHFIALKGSPGGDDYHVMWIDPKNPARMILGVDQGATISVDGGKSWTPWYNQPTGQFYHVTTGGGFPFYVYGQQQDSGSAAVPSRSDYGEIRYRDWFSPGGYEFGYIAADPLHPNINYAGGEAGSVVRFDRRTGELSYLFIHRRDVRTSGNAPMEFSPQDPHALYFGAQMVLKSTDAARIWRAISPDLTERPGPKRSADGTAARPGFHSRGVITTLALSAVAAREIWVGTSDGLVQLSRDDGASWADVSPPDLNPRAEISILEASHFEAGEAWAAVDEPDDIRPHFYRTLDFGKTWREIDAGISNFGIARVVREDPSRKGLLYAGTESGVYVSFDDGDGWQSLQLNLPTASVRDLAVHGNDLVAATFGRALWILDDVTPLRQMNSSVAAENVHFFKPEEAMRIRWDRNNDTPLPPEVPAGENPPDGAIFNYWLKTPPAGPITLAVYDATGEMVRQFSSSPPPEKIVLANVPEYWFAPEVKLTTSASLNRFVWNMRYAAPDALPSELSPERGDYQEFSEVNHAILGKTPRHYPLGAQIVPGRYELALTVDGQTYRQPLVVKMDPRIDVTQAGLQAQLDLEQKLGRGMAASADAYWAARALHAALADRQHRLAQDDQAKSATKGAAEFAGKLESVEEGTVGKPGFSDMNARLAELMIMIEAGDGQPTESAQAAVAESCQSLVKNFDAWRELIGKDLPALNRELKKRDLQPLPAPAGPPPTAGCGD